MTRPASTRSGDRAGQADRLAVTVVICAYTLTRWSETKAAVASVVAQQPAPGQVLLVIDHNPELATLARAELPDAEVSENAGDRGLSGARNTGLRAATEPITAFLDDDAEAQPGWLAALIEPYEDARVVATGGGVRPRWAGSRPDWLPPEFDWVVGCSYVGLPPVRAAVRNPIGANMSFRTQLALAAGGFNRSVGRVGARPRGCEETELAIRVTASADGAVIYVPEAAVDHHVGPERTRFRYFLRRCWHEGQSKAQVVGLVGASSGLSRERRQAAVIIPAAIGRDLASLCHGRVAGGKRIVASVAGLAACATGYLAGRFARRSAGR
jgi:glycosyltransferase involved in cell wall biosynthesis